MSSCIVKQEGPSIRMYTGYNVNIIAVDIMATFVANSWAVMLLTMQYARLN